LKLVQERVGNTLEAIGIGKDFLSRAQMAQQLREMIDKWDYMKSKSFCSTKEMVSKLKKLPTEWEKIFASYISDKELITKIYKVLKKLNSQKINDPMKKWVNELNRALPKEEVRTAKKKKPQENVFTIPGHKGNANQNHIKILPHPC
jgi:hypothetical protein